jgi:hypothetical protein
MLMNVTGVSVVNFTTKDGRNIEGRTVYVTYPDRNVVGAKTDKVFVGTNISAPTNISPGDVIDVMFNMRGKVDRVVADDIIDD